MEAWADPAGRALHPAHPDRPTRLGGLDAGRKQILPGCARRINHQCNARAIEQTRNCLALVGCRSLARAGQGDDADRRRGDAIRARAQHNRSRRQGGNAHSGRRAAKRGSG